MSVLVTGFGPFPGQPDNPTTHLVKRLAAIPGVTARVLHTTWAAPDAIAEAAAGAAVAVHFGVAGSRRRISYERLAHGGAIAAADAEGDYAEAPPPHTRYTRLDVVALADAARRAGFPVTVSSSPGTYICNAAYAAALAANPRALFVHVPDATPRGPLSLDAMERHALWLLHRLASARNRPVRPKREQFVG